MPKWGFTEEMRDTRPWGLPPEELEPGKIVADPIHGDVHLTRLEMRIVDSRPFQRLRRVRQLGSTHLVYPGATHTRFSHALGAVRAAQRLLDFAVEQREGIHPVTDLMGQWVTSEARYNEELARATVLARLGALLHDLAHISFGHSVEDEMGILPPHDENEWRLNRLWREFPPELRKLLEGEDGELETALKAVVAPELELESPAIEETYPFVQDLVGNTICADLLDYLARDHLYTGLPIALGHRFLSALFITPDGENEFFRRRLALSISRDGRERADVVSELLKYLRYRYELTERVLAHHAKLRADAMVGKLLLLWRDEIAEQLATDQGGTVTKALRAKADRALENELLWRGDDGLLEHLQSLGRVESPSPRAEVIAQLADELLNRNLFELAGRTSVNFAPAAQLREKYGDPEKRLGLERDLAEYAEIEAWKVAIWLPPEEMGLKVARVLVYDGSSVMHFNEYEAHGRKRGGEIDDAHKALWAISVFVHSSVGLEQREEILVRLAQRSGIRWERFHDAFGADTEEWPLELASRRTAAELGVRDRFEELLETARATPARSRSDEKPTFSVLKRSVEAIAESLGLKSS